MENILNTIQSYNDLDNSNNDSDKINNPKIILITSRLKENINYKPAEEILLEIIANRTGLNYEIIECDLYQTNNFFGRPPVLYFNGRVIVNQNIFYFFKDLIIKNEFNKTNSINDNTDENIIRTNNLFFDNLITILRDQIRFANEYYHYLKLKERREKNQNRKIFLSFFSNLFKVKIDSSAYEQISENTLNSFSVVTNLKNLYSDIEHKFSILIKHSYSNLNELIQILDKDLSLLHLCPIERMFYEYLIFSFLKEDKLLFMNSFTSRPFINYFEREDERNFSEIASYFVKIEEKIKTQSNLLIPNISSISSNYSQYVNNYSLAINPSHKKVKNIQEMEVTRSLYHNLFSIGIFSVTALILLYISTRRR